MFFFGHIGPSLLAARGMSRRPLTYPEAMMVAGFAILPDFADKLFFTLGLAPVLTTRLWGHTLLAGLLCCLLARFFIKPAWPWILAMPGHLILDGLWVRPVTLFWPLLGTVFDRGINPCPPEIAVQGILAIQKWAWTTDPWGQSVYAFAELAGLFLAWMALDGLGFGVGGLRLRRAAQ